MDIMTSGQIQAPEAMPLWECMWNALVRDGWRISHFAQMDEESGRTRHLVTVSRPGGDKLLCSAPTMAQAMQVIHAEAMDLIHNSDN